MSDAPDRARGSLRVTPLASGSQGNSLLVEAAGVRLLIDAGLGADDIERRLQAVDVAPRSIDALFVTHRHKDHVRGVTDFARRHRVQVLTLGRTARAIGTEVHRRLRRIEFGERVRIGGLVLHAIAVPHDAPDTAAVRIEAGDVRFGYATDLGCAMRGLVDGLAGCDGLFLEFNHERRLLLDGEDPPHLKRRIGSSTGHLDNDQAAALLGELDHAGLRHVWLGHLSRRNNAPALALAAARRGLGGRTGVALTVASQHEPSPSIELHPVASDVE